MATSQRALPRMSIEAFRRFVEDTPDEQHWELIDGVAMMMAPPTVAHQIIATDLQFLLNSALENHDPGLFSCQRVGVNLAPAVDDYDPEPDVVVIDCEIGERPGERYAGRFHLVAEIVSASDRVDVQKKRPVYQRMRAAAASSSYSRIAATFAWIHGPAMAGASTFSSAWMTCSNCRTSG